MRENILTFFREKRLGRTVLYFVKWLLIAFLIGGLGGVIGGVFSRGIQLATSLRTEHDWLLYLMPLGGLVIVWAYKIAGEEKNTGTNMILETVSTGDDVTPGTGPLIFIATIITHLVGGSAGREGAALQIGGWLGTRIGKLPFVVVDEQERKMVIMCGMSAVFAALFGTPVAASIFCLEVVNVGIMHYSAMLPCMIAAFVGKDMAGLFGVEPEAFGVHTLPDLNVFTVQPVVLLGILIAILSVGYILVLHNTGHLLKKWFPNAYVRILVTSAIFILMTLLVRTRVYSGSSMILIEEALEGQVFWPSFILKMLFTAVALGGGFKGGEIVPTLCVGATFGCLVGQIIGFNPPLMAACGMIGLFAAVTNCPIASILIGVELFQGQGLAYFAVVVSLAYNLSGYYSLYSSQRFASGKLKNIFVNRTPSK